MFFTCYPGGEIKILLNTFLNQPPNSTGLELVKLRFLAPSAGSTEIAKHRSSPRPLSVRSSGRALPGIEPCPPDYSGCKVGGLHHCATTTSRVEH